VNFALIDQNPIQSQALKLGLQWIGNR